MRALVPFALALLAGCAQPVDFAGVEGAGPSPAGADGPIAFYTAGPGDVMVVADRCAVDICDDAGLAAADRYSSLSYLGMRSDTEAVFLRRVDAAPPADLRPTDARGLFTPVRPETPATMGDFIPPRPEGAPAPHGVAEIVVNPIAGVAFGTDAFEIDIASATPARVVYTMSPAF
ncbi:hypothetical protein [Rubrimonas cliftonensis]|uniref:Secreted protein n=1 Tax=Rubrimonas cliftonensis TaxID=89524 RepID=A0A1H4DUN4_9RHOB|nr:hypothetical protein [Rubrimonas cliftonensis]SEA76464.1 hypothetical protein SAMN05444370_11154 [Rubrimonas cliftonensis]